MNRPRLKFAIIATVIVAVSGVFWLPDAIQWRLHDTSGARLETPQSAAVQQQPEGQGASMTAVAEEDLDTPAPKAARVEITEGPELEIARDFLAIIRWTTNNPGGTDDHFGVVYYGTSPTLLDQAAQNHIRLNRAHADTVFRVRLDGLKPYTTYYYSVTSTGSDGASDGVQSPVRQFTTPGPGG